MNIAQRKQPETEGADPQWLGHSGAYMAVDGRSFEAQSLDASKFADFPSASRKSSGGPVSGDLGLGVS